MLEEREEVAASAVLEDEPQVVGRFIPKKPTQSAAENGSKARWRTSYEIEACGASSGGASLGLRSRLVPSRTLAFHGDMNDFENIDLIVLRTLSTRLIATYSTVFF